MQRFWHHSHRLYPWLLAAVMEAGLTTPWLLLLYSGVGTAGWESMLPAPWLQMAAFLAAAVWESGTRRQEDEGRAGRIIALAVGVALVTLLARTSLSPAIRAGSPLEPNLTWAFAPIAGYLWFAGVRQATAGFVYGDLFSSLPARFGWMLAGLILLVVSGPGRSAALQGRLYGSLIAAFASGLLLLLVARQAALLAEQREQGEDGGTPPSGALQAAILALVGLTVSASLWLSPERLLAVMRAMGRLLDPVVALLLQLLVWVGYGVAWLLMPFWRWLQARLRQVRPQEVTSEMGEPPAQVLEEATQRGLPIDLVPYLKAALVIGVLVALAVALYRLNGRRRRAVEGDEEERISLGFWQSLLGDLRGLLRRQGQVEASAGAEAEEALGPGDPRLILRRLQAWGLSVGRPRRPAETPSRYGAALAEAEPGAARAAQVVTEVYNQVRYGSSPPTAAAVAEADAALADLPVKGFTSPTPTSIINRQGNE